MSIEVHKLEVQMKVIESTRVSRENNDCTYDLNSFRMEFAP